MDEQSGANIARDADSESALGHGTPPARKRVVTRKGRAGVDKREELLKAASKLFLKHGYEGGSINSLARSSGISKESIYRYFPSKEALFEAVVEKELESHEKALSTLAAIGSEEASLEQLELAAENILAVMTSDRTLALRRLMFQAATRNAEIGAHYHRIGPQSAYDQLEDFFRRLGHSKGHDPAMLSRVFLSLLLHEMMLARACRVEPQPDKKRITEWARQTVEVFASGYLD